MDLRIRGLANSHVHESAPIEDAFDYKAFHTNTRTMDSICH
ncbi:hypothetical protein ABH922_005313 [Rhodococcus sp. 27YEA15]